MWKQSEHVALIGDTGSGKTYLESYLLERRGAVIVLRTKPDDINFSGYETIRSVSDIRAGQYKYLLDPKYDRQKLECRKALEYVWRAGRWCVVIDELYYAQTRLKLDEPIERLLTQGRSKLISVVVGMQRAPGVTRFAISQATHVFSFSIEGRDVKTVKEATTPRIVPALERLKRFQYAYFNRHTKEVKIGNANSLGKVLG